jgi:primary-amine oxidase
LSNLIQEQVGPLPISQDTTIQPLDYFYNGINGPRVGFNGRFFDTTYQAAIDGYVTGQLSSIADITLDLTGLAYYGDADERTNAVYFATNPASTDGSVSIVWTPFRRMGLASYLQPTDLYFAWDFGGTDPSQYKLRMIVYNNVVYTSLQQLREAWESGSIEKRPFVTSDESFIRKDRVGPVRELEDRMAPTITEPEGKRYKLDEENKYIEYLGWKFYTRFDRDVGIQFYDVKFKEERILYELSLQGT